jgi:predicted Zn-dependent protease
MFLVWLVDTSGDWMHLIPGVTAIALCAAAALCDPSLSAPISRRRAPSRGLSGLAGGVAATVVLAIGGASLARATAARHYLDRARAELASSPLRAIDDSQRVLGIDDANLDAYYVKAAGQARFNLAAEARATLLRATQEAPQNFVTWALLGDLETRAGQLSAARGYYRRARRLDPRDPELAVLAAHPERGLRAGA